MNNKILANILCACGFAWSANVMGDTAITCSATYSTPQAASIANTTTQASTAIVINVLTGTVATPLPVGGWFVGYGPVPAGTATRMPLSSCTKNGVAMTAASTAVAGDVISCPIATVAGATGIEVGLFDATWLNVNNGNGLIDLHLYQAAACTLGQGIYWNVNGPTAATGGGACAPTLYATSCMGAPAPSAFDAVEVAAAMNTRIKSKLAGTAFNLDVLALNAAGTAINATTYKGTPVVELVDASVLAPATFSCATAALIPATVTPSPYTYTTATDKGRHTYTFSVVNAWKNVRVRVRDVAAGKTACSFDNFAIRPSQFTVTASLAPNPLSAGKNFTMTATSNVVAGYTGTPLLDVTKVQDHTPAIINPANLTGAFTAATGSAASGTFQYLEVGNISLLADAVSDTTFTAVDQPADCVAASSSNVLAGGSYGCNIGSAPLAAFGRFIPEHFDTTVTHGCASCGYTYSGQPFGVTVTAKNLAGGTTLNYNGAFAKAVTLSDANANTVGALANSAVPATAFVSGVATLSNPIYTFGNAKTVPTVIKLRAVDADAVTSLRVAPAVSIEGITEVRSGRISIANAFGSELTALNLAVAVQYYSASGWVTSTADNSTTFSSALSTAGGNLVTAIVQGPIASVSVVNPVVAAFVNGVRKITFAAPGAGNAGVVDVSLNAPSYLLTANNSAGVNPSVAGRATFGIYNNGGSNTYVYRGRRGR